MSNPTHYPANWDTRDIANHERYLAEYNEACESHGSAEYLASLLTGPDHSCPHPNKLRAGVEEKIPKRLGFFQKTRNDISFIETEKLCRSCYDLAVPQGFNTWSTAYKTGPVHQNQNENDFYPPMFEAGSEGFEQYAEVLDTPAANALADQEPAAEPREVLMPQNAEAREAWRFIKQEARPFYIDQLHLTSPWDPNAVDQQAEDLRVSRENAAAYMGCAKGIKATGIGGAGRNSAAEQRILAARGLDLPANFGGEAVGSASFEPDETFMPHQAYTGPSREVPEAFPEYYTMPEQNDIDETEIEMRGFRTEPTPDEIARRTGFSEPDEEQHPISEPFEFGRAEHSSVQSASSDDDQHLPREDVAEDDAHSQTRSGDHGPENEDEESQYETGSENSYQEHLGEESEGRYEDEGDNEREVPAVEEGEGQETDDDSDEEEEQAEEEEGQEIGDDSDEEEEQAEEEEGQETGDDSDEEEEQAEEEEGQETGDDSDEEEEQAEEEGSGDDIREEEGGRDGDGDESESESESEDEDEDEDEDEEEDDANSGDEEGSDTGDEDGDDTEDENEYDTAEEDEDEIEEENEDEIGEEEDEDDI